MYMMNSKKLTVFGSLALSLIATSALASNQTPGKRPSAMVEISIGAEGNSTGIYSPCAVNCGEDNTGSQSHKGTLIRFGFTGIAASELGKGNIGKAKVMFLPISMTMDMGEAQGDAFGHVVGYEGDKGHIKQMTGALVEANVNPAGVVSLRGKLLKAEYNRDKGIYDWRAIDASVGLQAGVMVGGSTSLNIEVDVGGGIGGVHLNGMEDLSAALNVAPMMDGAYTINPYAAVRAGLHTSSLKVELIGSVEKRIDLTSSDDRAVYQGRSMNVNSVHASGTAEVEFTFGGAGNRQMGRRYSVFADATYDFDTLTLSQMAFGNEDSVYRAFTLMAGGRVQF
jgi:hypothetical protein